MRIGIVAHMIHPQRFGGAETYARAMVKYLPDVDSRYEYVFVLHRDHGAEFGQREGERILVDFPVLAPYRRVLWEHLHLGQALRKEAFDLVHFLGSTATIGYRERSVVTIHETLRFQCPAATPSTLGWYYELNQRSIVRRGFDVIAVSEHDSSVMCDKMGLTSQKQHVVPLGGSERFSQVPDSPCAEDFLFIGFPYLHKNVPTLVRAFGLLRASSCSGRLHLVGIPENQHARFLGIAEQNACADSLVMHRPMSTDAIKNLIAKIAVVCLPSSFESFGLPILEGLSCGRSIACSDLPAFRELFADHVHRATSHSADALAAAMIAARKEYQSGTQRQRHRDFAAKFNWRATAEATAKVYERCLSRRSSGAVDA